MQGQSKNTKKKEIGTKTSYASVRKYQVVKGKRASKVSKFKRWLIEKVWKLTIKDTYYYNVHLDFYNGKIKPKDVVVDSNGVIYYVIDVMNNKANMVTYNALDEKPVIIGKIQIHRDNEKKLPKDE